MKVEEKKTKIVAVRYRPSGKLFLYETDDPSLSIGDKVVVESMFGLTVGTVIKEVDTDEVEEGRELKKVLRKATEEDLQAMEKNRRLEEEAFNFCLERIEARGMPMKLVATEVTLDIRRIIFYFTAEGRIDFRELVKDLAAKFRTRIEMRQIGVRDEAKMLGGVGVCGRVLCCNCFLDNFVPISVRMAKEQELVLNTTKLTGLCGRLMCCLSYEYEGTIEGEDEIPVETEETILCEECPSETVSSIVRASVEEAVDSNTHEEEEAVEIDRVEKEETVTTEEYTVPVESQSPSVPPVVKEQEAEQKALSSEKREMRPKHEKKVFKKSRAERRRRRKRKKHKRRR
jgi:cell fate regulator YaaT (PSP1 superfamily)